MNNCHCIVGQFVPPTREEIAANVEKFPLKEMLKRGWISGNIRDRAQMQAELERFFHPVELPKIESPRDANRTAQLQLVE